MTAPVEVRPRWSNDRTENVRAVRETLVAAGRADDAAEFEHLVPLLQREFEAGRLDEHPVTVAARKVGADVHWVS